MKSIRDIPTPVFDDKMRERAVSGDLAAIADAMRPRYVGYLARNGYDDTDGNASRMAGYMSLYRQGAAAKGLMLMGRCGRGKTAAMRIFARWAMIRDVVTAPELVVDFKRRGGVLDQLESPPRVLVESGLIYPDMVLDDMGAEPRLTDFGQTEELMGRLVMARDRLYERYGARLHVTTNLDREQIIARYGDRIMSRLDGMCWQYHLKGSDRRATNDTH